MTRELDSEGASASVIAFAVLPPDSIWTAVPLFIVTAAAGYILVRITNVAASGREYRRKIGWVVAVGILLLGGVMLASTVGHQGGAIWLSWIVGALVFVGACSGTRFVDGNPR